jgi:hypothetical protein
MGNYSVRKQTEIACAITKAEQKLGQDYTDLLNFNPLRPRWVQDYRGHVRCFIEDSGLRKASTNSAYQAAFVES